VYGEGQIGGSKLYNLDSACIFEREERKRYFSHHFSYDTKISIVPFDWPA